jgi:DNA-directed RNA polymerase subunit beta'
LDTLFTDNMEPAATMSFEDKFAEEFNSQDVK